MFGVNLKWMNTPVLLEVFAVHVSKIKLITAIVQIFPIDTDFLSLCSIDQWEICVELWQLGRYSWDF